MRSPLARSIALIVISVLTCLILANASQPSAFDAPLAGTVTVPAHASVAGVTSGLEARPARLPRAHSVKPASTVKAKPKAAPAPVPSTRSQPSTEHHTDHYHGSVAALIRSVFGRVAPRLTSVALCIGWRESHFDPNAKNPYSSASGVFQFVRGTWLTLRHRYGFDGASVFSAYANVSVAAYRMRDDPDLSDWGGGC